jgi:hypothetical protein
MQQIDHEIQIAVLDRGFVYVGRAKTDDDWLYLTDAQNIRRWGTSKGLGELAQNGPMPNTKLDKVGSLKAPMKAIISLIDVEKTVWEKAL